MSPPLPDHLHGFLDMTSLLDFGRRLALPVLLASVLTACSDDPEALKASARESLARSDVATAIIQLKNALQSQPDAADTRFLLAQALLRSGDFAGAESELSKAKAAGHPEQEVLPLLAEILVASGRFQDVEAQLASTQLADPQAQAIVLAYLGEAQLALGQQAQGLASLDAALALNSNQTVALLNKARLAARQGNYQEAGALLDRALAAAPRHAGALKQKGDLLFYGLNQLDEALAVYQQAVAWHPGFRDAQISVVRIHMNRGQLDQAEQAFKTLQKMGENYPKTLFVGAQLALAQGQIQQARTLAQKLLRLAPDNSLALELAGAVEFRSNALVQAEPLLARALTASPDANLARRLLTQTYLRTGQLDKAEKTLPADLGDSTDAEMLGVAGQLYLVRGQQAKAQQFFEKATALAPDDPEKKTSLALARLASGDADAAFGELRNIASEDPGVVADMALINALVQRRELDKALQAIDQLSAKKADDPIPWHLRSQVLVFKRDLEGARKALDQALKLAPTFFPAVKSHAALDLQAKQPDAARQRYEAFVERYPKNADAILALAELQATRGAPLDEVVSLLNKAIEVAPSEPAPRLILVDYLLQQNAARRALTAAQAAAAVLPESASVVDALGRAQISAGEHHQAVNTFGKLAVMQPRAVGPHMRMAQAHVAAKDLASAAQALRKALDVQPDHLPALQALAELALRNNSADEALAVSKQIQQQRSTEAVGHVIEGDVLLTLKKPDAALQAYRTALKIAPSSTAVAMKMFNALASGNRQAQAQTFAQDWLQRQPRDHVFAGYVAERAMQGGQLAQAEKYYRLGLQLKPDHVIFLNNLAWVLSQRGDKESLIHVERANTLAPDNPDILDTFAGIVSAQGNFARALSLQQKAVSLQPERGDLRLNLARLQLRAGKTAEAKATLTRLRELGDKFGGQDEVTRLLKDL